MQYRFRLDDRTTCADPASFWQPHSSDGASVVYDPNRFAWSDHDWRGVPLEQLAIYEVDVGRFTPEGTFDAVIPRLPALRDLGITAVELTSIAQFATDESGGLRCEHCCAAQHAFGGPDGLQRLVDACHAHGMAVIVDLAQGPSNSPLEGVGQTHAINGDDSYETAAPPVASDGVAAEHVRRFARDAARHWISHFHLDGLRLSLLDSDLDPWEKQILVDLQQVVSEVQSGTGRRTHLIARSPRHDVGFLDPPSEGGCGLDAVWNDDFHHALHVLLTGDREGAYADFGDPHRQIVKALNQTFVFDGFCSHLRGKPYSAPAGGHDGRHFVISLQESTTLRRRPQGDRLSTRIRPEQLRMAAGLMLMAPHIPLIFMGDEYGERQPFPRSQGGGCTPSSTAESESVHGNDDAGIAWQWDGSQQNGLRRLHADLLALRRTLPPLRDFQNRTARIIPAQDGYTFLHLARGDGEASFGTVHVWFNWNDRELALPGKLSDRAHPLLSSESLHYGGTRNPQRPVTTLAPYEFAIFGT